MSLKTPVGIRGRWNASASRLVSPKRTRQWPKPSEKFEEKMPSEVGESRNVIVVATADDGYRAPPLLLHSSRAETQSVWTRLSPLLTSRAVACGLHWPGSGGFPSAMSVLSSNACGCSRRLRPWPACGSSRLPIRDSLMPSSTICLPLAGHRGRARFGPSYRSTSATRHPHLCVLCHLRKVLSPDYFIQLIV